MDAEVVVLVEGESDAAAVATLAARYGIGSARLQPIVAFGVTNFRRILTELAARRPRVRVVGLYDDPEEHVVRHALEAGGLDTRRGRGGLEHLGFHACVADLEDEFIRAIGVDGVEQLIEREGELPSLRRFQAQPAQQRSPGRPAAPAVHGHEVDAQDPLRRSPRRGGRSARRSRPAPPRDHRSLPARSIPSAPVCVPKQGEDKNCKPVPPVCVPKQGEDKDCKPVPPVCVPKQGEDKDCKPVPPVCVPKQGEDKDCKPGDHRVRCRRRGTHA